MLKTKPSNVVSSNSLCQWDDWGPAAHTSIYAILFWGFPTLNEYCPSHKVMIMIWRKSISWIFINQIRAFITRYRVIINNLWIIIPKLWQINDYRPKSARIYICGLGVKSRIYTIIWTASNINFRAADLTALKLLHINRYAKFYNS